MRERTMEKGTENILRSMYNNGRMHRMHWLRIGCEMNYGHWRTLFAGIDTLTRFITQYGMVYIMKARPAS